MAYSLRRDEVIGGFSDKAKGTLVTPNAGRFTQSDAYLGERKLC